MAGQSEFAAKQCLATKQLNAARALDSAGLLEPSAAMHWTALRTFLFAQLALDEIDYASTNDAIVALLSKVRSESCKADIILSYLVGTMSEWDECFLISRTQLSEMDSKCENVRQHFRSRFEEDYCDV